MGLEQLRIKESILAGSYWMNIKYYKDMIQIFGSQNPEMIALNDEVVKIQHDWHDVQNQIKELLNKY